MKSILILHHLRVENANAIAGMTYGFPAISSFLGFTHALSRKLQQAQGVQLGGCAVVCHQHHVCAYQPAGWGDFTFTQTRNPLTKEEKSPSFVEEGRMHLDVSLVLECDFTLYDLHFADDLEANIALLEQYVASQVQTQRLAGGTILSLRAHKPVSFLQVPEDDDKLPAFKRKVQRQLMPGFLLVNRSDLLQAHFQQLLEANPEAELMDAWLDFVALKFAANSPDDSADEPASSQNKQAWQRIEKPANGWLVPLTTGFTAISPLYPAGQVANARDKQTPFRFVESVYSVGQWLSPHRIIDLQQMFWRYQVSGEHYLCDNQFRPS
jgi:CRISPR-associated protein Csy2